MIGRIFDSDGTSKALLNDDRDWESEDPGLARWLNAMHSGRKYGPSVPPAAIVAEAAAALGWGSQIKAAHPAGDPETTVH